MTQKRSLLMPKQTAKFRFQPDWSKIGVGSAMVAIIASLYLFNLGGLVTASPSEQLMIDQGNSVSNLFSNPLLLPYKLLAFILLQLPGSDLLHVRLTSVLGTCVSVWLFFIVARRWYGLVTGLWTSVLFAASGWVLQTGRAGTAASLIMLMVIGLINLASWVNNSDDDGRVLVVFAAAAGLSLFVPAGIWFVLASVVLLYKPLLAHRAAASGKQVALAAGIFIVLFALLAVGLVQHTGLLAQWVGLPGELPGLVTLAKQAAFSLIYFVLKGPMLPESWLAHTPLLDVASSVFLLFGILFYARHLGNARTRLLLSFVVIGIVLVALNGAGALHYLVPAVYLVVGGGVAYVMHQWNKVFPRNPIARSVSVGLMVLLLACIVSFHAQRYFIAWRYSPNTVEAYRGQSKPTVDTPATHLIQ